MISTKTKTPLPTVNPETDEPESPVETARRLRAEAKALRERSLQLRMQFPFHPEMTKGEDEIPSEINNDDRSFRNE